MSTQDPFHLQRFLDAQENDYADALREIKQGYKQNRWIWFIFPQMFGLGTSEMARHYGIRGREEAKEYIKQVEIISTCFLLTGALETWKRTDYNENTDIRAL